MNKQDEPKLDFYIASFRKFFKKVLVIYVLMLFCIAFVYYKIHTRPDLTYYAASESGKLRKLTAYTQSQAEYYIQHNN